MTERYRQNLGWSELSPEEKLKRFENLNLPPEVRFVLRYDQMEVVFPLRVLHPVVDVFLKAGYVTFIANVFLQSGNVTMDVMHSRDHPEEEEGQGHGAKLDGKTSD